MHQGGCERWRRVGAEQEAAQFFCVSATDTQCDTQSARFTNSAWARFWALGLNGHRRSKQTKAAPARLPRAALAHFDLREWGQGARETQEERLESACCSPDGGDISAWLIDVCIGSGVRGGSDARAGCKPAPVHPATGPSSSTGRFGNLQMSTSSSCSPAMGSLSGDKSTPQRRVVSTWTSAALHSSATVCTVICWHPKVQFVSGKQHQSPFHPWPAACLSLSWPSSAHSVAKRSASLRLCAEPIARIVWKSSLTRIHAARMMIIFDFLPPPCRYREQSD